MKLTTFILITVILQVSAATFAQKITLSEKNSSLVRVFDKISDQSGYDFLVSSEMLRNAKPVTIQVRNLELKEVLKKIFEEQPLDYNVQEKMVVVSKKSSYIDNIIARFQSIGVRGKVVDEQNQPLVGASVNVNGKSQGTKTDAHGNFYLANVDEKATLVISYVGFKTTVIAVKADVGILTLNLEDNSLDQIQIIAYGEVKQKFSTSNATSISGQVISRQPVTNPLIAIQGRIPGLLIRQTSGLNTGAINVNVQGRNSLTSGNQPFYVIDGVPITPNALDQGFSVAGSIGPSGSMSNLNFLNPNEIESITVLKDADATAIYGSRAANGAILITTKKGKVGQTKVALNLQTGWGKEAIKQKLLNTEQYIALRKEAYTNNNNQAIPASAIDINGTWDPTRNVNWQNELIGGTAQFQNLQASVSGGSEHTQFLAGAVYIRQTPVFNGDFSNVKTSVNFNINHASTNEQFRFFLSGSYLEGNNQLPKDDLTADATRLAPNFPELYNPDGTVNWASTNARPFQATNDQPAAKLMTRYTNKSSNLIANSQLSYELIPGLVVKSTFGYNSLQTNESGLTPSASITPENRFYGIKPFARFSTKDIKSWIIEPQATFTKIFTVGTIDALVGGTFQSTDNYLLTLYGDEYNNDVQLGDLNSAGTKSTGGSLQNKYNYSAIFGRLNYRIKDKYIINLSARRDGSSRFGSENLFNSFYSIAGAWLFSEENFFHKLLPFMNYGKLRTSYGTTGNDQIADYSFYSLYDTYGIGIDAPYLGISALNPRGLSNPYLQWEETRKLNFGIDLGFLNSRILLTTNYFRNRSSNQLLGQNLSIVTGFGTIARNLPALVQNTGWEFSLDYAPIKSNRFIWNGSINLTIPRNKLLRYDGLENSSDKNLFAIEKPVTVRKLYAFAGVNPETGLYQFRNSKGELTSTPSSATDRSVYVTTDPKYYGGVDNTFSYGGLSLDIFFQFISQLGQNRKFLTLPGTTYNRNELANVLDHWKKPGDYSPIQMVSNNFGKVLAPWTAATQSDGIYSSATYVRLKNVTISYDLGSDLVKRAKVSSARIFAQGQNLFTLTDFQAGDPEVQSTGNLGLLRMFTIGAQLTF